MLSSCVALFDSIFGVDTASYWETDDKDGVLGYHYRIYVENKTDETIEVFYRNGSKIGSINKNKIKQINVSKNRYIYIIGKKSQRQYLIVMVSTDRDRLIIQ
jgi:hypothetical protein